ncbi:MAG: VCBS repeat-containing protein, partial [Chitinophagaceae bacterium]|nr:VCBS repeat-containing protein [Chitinophagaceae bacterium]
GNQTANKLYLNKGNFQFEDISEKAGFDPNKKQWSTGVVLVDINADGWLDIYVCNAGNMGNAALRKNQLFINNHNLTFTEKAAEYGLDNDGYTTHASFFDYDLDGDLDCFIVNNSPIPVNTLNYANVRNQPAAKAAVADFLKGGGDHLYRNDRGKYKEVTYESGIHGSLIGFGLGVTIGDVNEDGYPDVYVSNDFFERDYLYINQKNGTFIDDIENRMQHVSMSSMGADMADINNDGRPDIFTTDMLPANDFRLKTNTSFEGYDVVKLKEKQGFYNQFTQNALQVNNGDGRFVETGFYSKVAASDWSWGALVFDADNDSKSDILVCNGIYRDVTDQDFIDFFANEVMQQMVISGKKEEVSTIINKMPSVSIANKLFRNKGNLQFEDIGDSWGLDKKTFSNGAVYTDIDNDGDLDLVISNVNQKAVIYRNNTREKMTASANYIAVALQYKTPNNFAIGATITIFSNQDKITRTIMPARGFQSSLEYKQTIGLGTNTIDSAEVLWPNGTITQFKPQLNKLNTIVYDSANVKKQLSQKVQISTLFTSINQNFDKHKEDDYVDFYTERNIPFMLSKQGPKAAVADVDGDGLDDIFMGGAFQQPSQLYLQKANGFVKKLITDFEKFSFNDVTTAFFFDADKDGDNDLFIGGGGNMAPASADAYQNQFYKNDGKGNFSLQPGAFGISHTNCGAAVVMDYDNDGYPDIFIGSRSEPQQYGIIPRSFIFHNNKNGTFEDVTARIAPFMNTLGMITSAVYADVNNDARKELIITGDYMGIQAFNFVNDKFIPIKTGLENNYGWWQQIKLADLDGDGDMDMVLGNKGEDFYLHPTKDNPVKIWINDFDQNGTIDKVFTQGIAGRDMPVFMKKDITDQLPSLKKSNLKHVDYAAKSIQDLFGKELEGAYVQQVNTSSSMIAINNGKGNFTLMPLPMQAQWSSVYAIVIKD